VESSLTFSVKVKFLDVFDGWSEAVLCFSILTNGHTTIPMLNCLLSKSGVMLDSIIF